MTSPASDEVFGIPLIYAPALAYSDLRPITISALRQRDWEVFEGHGPFCRHVFAIERDADTPKGDRIHVVVWFDDGKWVRQMGEALSTWRILQATKAPHRDPRQVGRRRA